MFPYIVAFLKSLNDRLQVNKENFLYDTILERLDNTVLERLDNTAIVEIVETIIYIFIYKMHVL